MAQFGKSSSKRGKPSYVNSIIGVSLVLFLFGIMGWFFLNLRKTGDYFKENIKVSTYLYSAAPKKRIDSLTQYISALPYVNRVEYVTKEKATQKWNAENDSTWKSILSSTPLPESIEFFVKADHVQTDSLNNLQANLQGAFPGVIQDFNFPKATVTKVTGFVKTVAILLLVAVIILAILVVFSIDNTIRLAMYSNRFLIKTMQMVGATRWFIAKPINRRAVINGLIASALAIAAVWLSVGLIENMVPILKQLHDTNGLLMLFGIMTAIGITITLLSTHRAVIKYLKLKLDDLY